MRWMEVTAMRMANAVDWTGAGTVEFLSPLDTLSLLRSPIASFNRFTMAALGPNHPATEREPLHFAHPENEIGEFRFSVPRMRNESIFEANSGFKIRPLRFHFLIV